METFHAEWQQIGPIKFSLSGEKGVSARLIRGRVFTSAQAAAQEK